MEGDKAGHVLSRRVGNTHILLAAGIDANMELVCIGRLYIFSSSAMIYLQNLSGYSSNESHYADKSCIVHSIYSSLFFSILICESVKNHEREEKWLGEIMLSHKDEDRE